MASRDVLSQRARKYRFFNPVLARCGCICPLYGPALTEVNTLKLGELLYNQTDVILVGNPLR